MKKHTRQELEQIRDVAKKKAEEALEVVAEVEKALEEMGPAEMSLTL